MASAFFRVTTVDDTGVQHQDEPGNAGAFTQLITRHPSLAKQLRSELITGRVKLVAGGDRGRLKFVNGAIQRFQQACRELGLGAGDYPFNQHDKAVRSLARVLRGWLDDDYALTAHATGARSKPSSALRRSERAVPDAFDTVEFDAHKLDLRLKVILETDPLGQEHSLEIERVWLLAIIDVIMEAGHLDSRVELAPRTQGQCHPLIVVKNSHAEAHTALSFPRLGSAT